MTTGKTLLKGIRENLVDSMCNEYLYLVTEEFVPKEDYSKEWLREKFDWVKDGTNFIEARNYLYGECRWISKDYNDEKVLAEIGLDIDLRDEFLNDEENHECFYDWCVEYKYTDPEHEFTESEYEEAKRDYFEYGKVSRDFASELLYDKLCDYFFDETLHELKKEVVNKVGRLMVYVLNEKQYQLETYQRHGTFFIHLRNIRDEKDRIPIGLGELTNYEIEEDIIEYIKNHFSGKIWTTAKKLRYMADTKYKNNFIETLAEQLTEKFITNFIYFKLSNGLLKAITESAKEYFTEKTEDIWKVILDETNDRLEKLELTTDETNTLKDFLEVCESNRLEGDNCYERELWKRRLENLETILERVIETEPATV